MLSAFGSALLVILILALVYFLRYTNRGRILLDQLGRPGEYDDEQAFAKDEAEALEEMDDIQRAEYMRAKCMMIQQAITLQATDSFCSFRPSQSARVRSN